MQYQKMRSALELKDMQRDVTCRDAALHVIA
jgi:hypothetical protein